AQAAQEAMIAALPAFPRYGFYVKTGLAGYGPDLESDDLPATSWEDVALQIAYELGSAADFNAEGASALADRAREADDRAHEHFRLYAQAGAWENIAEAYHEADEARRLADELGNLKTTFDSLAEADDPAPLYQGRPELRHARIWNLVSEQFPLDISHNSRLYVWECEEDPGSDDDEISG